MQKVVAALLVILSLSVNVFALGVSYFPDVTPDMSEPDYWADSNHILMTYEEILNQNSLNINRKGTGMYDLKSHPEFVNGVSINESILTSTRSDAAYYTGWTYIESSTLATEADFNEFVLNTTNPNALEKQRVLYAVATKRTGLRTFPSPKAIWDDTGDKDLDYQFLASIRVNEPVVITSVSADGNYYLAKSICCSGWIPSQDVAICSDKAQWLSAWDISPEDALVVYGDKVFTQTAVTGKETSDLMLTMGTVLKKVRVDNPNELIDNRAAYQNYVVYIPVRNSDGSYGAKPTLISEHEDVSDGYLSMTSANIAMVTFGALGNTYGWGGALSSDDCSGYIRNIYKCFGLELARNTSWQEQMPMGKIDMKGMCRDEREALLSRLPFGTVLYFNGHEMMYLGARNGKHYVISAVGSVMQPGNDTIRQRIRSTVINTLDVKRANGNTWMDELTLALVPYYGSKNPAMPGYMWYHEGVKYCVDNKLMGVDSNKYFGVDKEMTEADAWAVLLAKATGGKPSTSDYVKDKKVTREEVAGILYEHAVKNGEDTSVYENTDISFFKDSYDISDEYVKAVKYLVGKGVLTGKNGGTFNPSDKITRAEFALVVKRYFE